RNAHSAVCCKTLQRNLEFTPSLRNEDCYGEEQRRRRSIQCSEQTHGIRGSPSNCEKNSVLPEALHAEKAALHPGFDGDLQRRYAGEDAVSDEEEPSRPLSRADHHLITLRRRSFSLFVVATFFLRIHCLFR
ncbi:hypothetical protein PMAYCL1PPCAC_18619, partial [Pristionchus mayeri]